jgi:hypothetical protein
MQFSVDFMNTMKNPQIKIQHSRFIDPIFIGYLQTLPEWKYWHPPTQEQIDKRIKRYQELWDKYGEKILNGICEATGMEFRRNVIDVHIVSGTPQEFSRPLVMWYDHTDESFLITITHELIHCFFVDNDPIYSSAKSIELFPHADEITQKHIEVYAVLQYVFADVVVRPDAIERKKSIDTGAYDKAWGEVGIIGYEEIIKKIKYHAVSVSASTSSPILTIYP